MEFILALYVHIPPDNNRDFLEVDWHYKRYLQHQKEVSEAQNDTGGSMDIREMLKNHPDINNNK
jgi:hypothetical protein